MFASYPQPRGPQREFRSERYRGGCSPKAADPGTLFQRGDGLWVGKVRDPRSVRTGARRMRIFSDKYPVAAAETLDRLIDELDSEHAGAGGYSTSGWLRVWADEIHAVKVRPSTIRRYRSVIDHHIMPAIGEIPWCACSPIAFAACLPPYRPPATP